MIFGILYYKKVQEEIRTWNSSDQARYLRITDQIEQRGPNLGLPYTKSLGEGLFEIRAGQGRAFYCTAVGQKVVILHAIKKQSNRTPLRHLKTARNRMKDWRENLEDVE